MKTFSSALHVLRKAFLPRAQTLSLSGCLCIERKGVLVCCTPGAPIVRLPTH